MKLYYIAVYDISSPLRLAKVLKIFRKYLEWVQNSAFEGELTETQFLNLKKELRKVVNKDEDSILFFFAENKKYVSKEILGIEKNELTNII
ncbi:MAG: CRISPR-associated endonuclease Cas2 [Ignavibacteria bacterium]|nr:CRISPR-associated endonuclease Cas2 [Ignavibacteria bacterium]